jgi:hypothetical protein
MPADVLVMCTQCGRPQFAGEGLCIACGAKLPQTPVTKAELGQAQTARERLLDAYDPFLEVNLGSGRRLLLSQRRLEWHPALPKEPVLVDLKELELVRLRFRPVWESLPFAVAGVAFAILASLTFARVGGLFLALVATVACFLQKRCFLELVRKDGAEASLVLGMGRSGSSMRTRVESIWGSLRPALERLGVKVEERR